MRPYGFAFAIALVAGRNEPALLITVLLLPARSAEPPQNSGSTFAIAAITSPEAFRVATSFPGAKTGSSLSQPAGSSLDTKRFSSAARSELAVFQTAKFLSQSARSAAPRSFILRTCAITSAGAAKLSSGFNPRSTFVAAISSAPRAEP